MDNLLRDAKRLSMIEQMFVGQERFTASAHLKDFTHYYFSRFAVNLTSAFKDFTVSEITDFNHRNNAKLDAFFKRPTMVLAGIIIPIPKGMVKTYSATLTDLTAVLSTISPDTIVSDTRNILSVLESGKIKDLHLLTYTKEDFDANKVSIGRLFGKTGLTHATADHVFESKDKVQSVNKALLVTTSKYYPDIITLDKLIKTVESAHAKSQLSLVDKEKMAERLMGMAYRLSILATVMNHVQEMEHSFVKSLNMLMHRAN